MISKWMTFAGSSMAIIMSLGCTRQSDNSDMLERAATKSGLEQVIEDAPAQGEPVVGLRDGSTTSPTSSDADVSTSSQSSTTSIEPETPELSSSAAMNAPATTGSPTPEASLPANNSNITADNTSGNADTNYATSNIPVDYRQIIAPEADELSALNAKQIINQLARVDRGLQGLLLHHQAGVVDSTTFRDEAMRLSTVKLIYSEHLIENAKSKIEQEYGLLGKMEALSQLSGLGDRTRASDLRAFTEKVGAFESPDVARQAALVQLGFALSDYNVNPNTTTEVRKYVDLVLSDPRALRLPEFKMLQQVYSVLLRRGEETLANEVRSKIISSFTGNTDAVISQAVWSMQATESAAYLELDRLLRSPSIDVAALKTVVSQFIEQLPSQWSVKALADQIPNLEFTNQTEAASVIADAIQQNINLYTSELLRSEATVMIDGFRTRTEMIGKPLVLRELATLDGDEFNLAAHRGDVVLVVFWASWCQVCKGEFPELKTLYETYHPKGFEVVGINLDENPKNMQDIISAFGLPWINLRSSNPAAVGMDTMVAKDLGLKTTPLTILLDRNGNVVARQIHHEALVEKVTQLVSE